MGSVNPKKTKPNTSWFSKKNLLFLGFFGISGLSIVFQMIFDPTIFSKTALPSPFENYSSKYQSFQILHPHSWNVGETPQGNHGDKEVAAVILPMKNPLAGEAYTLIIIARKDATGNTLDDVINWGKQRASKCKNYLQGGQFREDHGNVQGIRLDYSCTVTTNYFTKQQAQAKCIDYYAMKENEGYAVSFCSEENLWNEVSPVFEQMRQSFKIG